MTILSWDLSKLEWPHYMAYLALGNKNSEKREENGIKEDRIWFCETESGQHLCHGTVRAELTILCLGNKEERKCQTWPMIQGMGCEAGVGQVLEDKYHPAGGAHTMMQRISKPWTGN